MPFDLIPLEAERQAIELDSTYFYMAVTFFYKLKTIGLSRAFIFPDLFH
jgi:hypothetical protein